MKYKVIIFTILFAVSLVSPAMALASEQKSPPSSSSVVGLRQIPLQQYTNLLLTLIQPDVIKKTNSDTNTIMGYFRILLDPNLYTPVYMIGSQKEPQIFLKPFYRFDDFPLVKGFF